jgi:hypothetical protein
MADITALPDATTAELPEGDSLCVTIDEEDSVLELIYSNSDGIYVRDGGEWSLVNTENEDQPTIDDQEWFDVNPAFIDVYDGLMQTSDGITREDAVPYGTVSA